MAIFNSKQLVYQRVGGLSEVAGCWPHSETREECDADEGTFAAFCSNNFPQGNGDLWLSMIKYDLPDSFFTSFYT